MSDSTFEHPEELLPWYVNGTLEGPEEEAVREHLSSCLVCRRQVEELRAMQTAVRDIRAKPPPDGLDRLLAEVDRSSVDRRPKRSKRSTRRRFVQLRRFSAVAAVLLAVGAGIVVTQSRAPLPEPPPTMRDANPADAVVRATSADDLARGEFVLRWERDPEWSDATLFLRVTTTGLESIVEARDPAGDEYRIPEDALAEVESGARLLWQIELVRSDGARETSPTFSATLLD